MKEYIIKSYYKLLINREIVIIDVNKKDKNLINF